MHAVQTILVANDNDPPSVSPRGDSVGFRALVVEKQREYRHIARNSTSTGQAINRSGRDVFLASVAFWMASAGALAAATLTEQPLIWQLVAALAFIWSSLWTRFVAQDQDRNITGEIGMLAAILGFAALGAIGVQHVGLDLSQNELLSILVVTTLLVGWISTSQTALMVSAGLGLVWAALYFESFLTPETIMLGLPLIWAGQIGLGLRLKSRLAVFLSLCAAYAWIGGFALQQVWVGNMSALYLAGGTFLFASLHYRAAKAAEDIGVSHLGGHIVISWGLATLSLMAIQDALINPNAEVWDAALWISPLMKMVWGIFAAILLGLILLSGFLRRKHARMFMSSIFTMTCLTAIIPLFIWYHDGAIDLFEISTGLPAYPTLAVLLGGAILASALFFTLNSIRRSRYSIAVVGMILLAVEAQILLTSDLFWIENLFALGLAFVVSLSLIIMMGHVNESDTQYVGIPQPIRTAR